MVKRTFWLKKIEQLFSKRNIIWLYGVRRAGKTFLCKSIPGILYFDCEIPEVRRRVEDEAFLKSVKGKIIALDEIHRLSEPSQVLKIAADHYPDVKIIATGSSTLEANKKFRDKLTGRKNNLHLTPSMSTDIADFNVSLDARFLKGGLPEFMISNNISIIEYNEWIESYWAKDITGIFGVEKKDAYIKFIELLFLNSSGIFEATSYAAKCEVTRQTIKNYLSLLEATSLITIIRPFSEGKAKEIIAAPKVYAFDTGFMAFFRGWEKIRSEDYDIMWEHYILNEIVAILQSQKICYWRDKAGHEIDFILYKNPKEPIAIEAKWLASYFDIKNLLFFRKNYPKGKNYLITHDTTEPYEKTYPGLKVTVAGISEIEKIIVELLSPVFR